MMQIVSFSGGKDSTAMLIAMKERGEQVDSVVWFDSGWEYPQLQRHISKVEGYLGQKIEKVVPPIHWDELCLKYGWPSWLRRWCSRDKVSAMKRHFKGKEFVSCQGIAADEQARAEKQIKSDKQQRRASPKRFPLIEYGITQSDALKLCKGRGFDFGGLYNDFARLSCFCCPLKPVSELRVLRSKYPQLWDRMLALDDLVSDKSKFHKCGHKLYTLRQLDSRFEKESCQECFHEF